MPVVCASWAQAFNNLPLNINQHGHCVLLANNLITGYHSNVMKWEPSTQGYPLMCKCN